jgi:diguanylate cyclase (GGDEF)-like protein
MLKRKAITLILIVMGIGGLTAILLHLFESNPHPISLALPPLTFVFASTQILYLINYPQHISRVIKITIGWGCFIIIFPEYYFLIEALLNPQNRLIETLPPISSGLLLLSTAIITFLRPREIARIVLLLWVLIAAPIIVYLIFHPQELLEPRGIDLIVSFIPGMGINFCLILFYSRLQDTANQLCIERFHFKQISEKDALTGALNRGAGEKILQDLIENAEPEIGIILSDIDHFKRINDQFGHLIGDRVLQIVTHTCQSQLRKNDTFIRWGGEEFLIVVTGDSLDQLSNLAERLRMGIAHQQIAEVGKVTASFGVAILAPQENLNQLFSRADEALYLAKKQGRNQVAIA